MTRPSDISSRDAGTKRIGSCTSCPRATAQDFLNMLITQHNRVPPAEWDGSVRLANK